MIAAAALRRMKHPSAALNQFAWLGGALIRSSDSGGTAPRLSSVCSGLAFGPRMPVASNSVTTTTPWTGSLIISAMTVSTDVVLGSFGRLALIGTAFFAAARFDLALVTRFSGAALAVARFALFPRAGLVRMRALLRVAVFPLRAAARFFR